MNPSDAFNIRNAYLGTTAFSRSFWLCPALECSTLLQSAELSKTRRAVGHMLVAWVADRPLVTRESGEQVCVWTADARGIGIAELKEEIELILGHERLLIVAIIDLVGHLSMPPVEFFSS
jgi:hypothetical protein